MLDHLNVRLRDGWRSVRARPGLSLVTILTLALGLGVNAALAALIDGAVLRPFPFPEPDRLVGIGAAFPKLNRPVGFFEVLSGPEYADVRDQARTLVDVAAFDLNNEVVTVDGQPARVFAAFVSHDLFRTLQVAPVLGRGFTDDDLRTGAPVAIISHAFWRAQLGGRPDAIGRAIDAAGRLRTIVGVMPARTRIYGTDLWVPMAESVASLPRTRRQFNGLARLAPGASADDASRELARLSAQIDRAHRAAVPEYEGFTLAVSPWTAIQVWGFSGVAMIVFGAVGLVLLLMTTNLASLLLARAVTRRREMAVRAALGADRRRLLAQLASETLVQTALGCALGLALAWLGVRALPALLPAGLLPDDVSLALNGRVLVFLAGLSALAAVIVGTGPAWQLSRARPAESLASESGRVIASRATRRAQAAIVGLQVAIAVVVAGTAALLASGTWRLLSVDRGFDPADTVIARLTLPPARYDGEASVALFEGALERLRRSTRVADASASNQPPPGVFSRSPFQIDGRVTAAGAPLPSAFYTIAASRYRETLGLRVTRGRWYDERAGLGGPREIVINDSAVRQFWNGEDPIGQRIRISGASSDGAWITIVGVAADTRNRGLVATPAPEMIGSFRQVPDRRRTQLYFVVRARADVDGAVSDLRSIVRDIDPAQPLYAVSTIDRQFEDGVAARRVAAGLLLVFAILALALAGLAIFGVLAHAVGTRTPEIGLRLALGARRRTIARLMLAHAMRPMAAGLALGVGALLLGRQTIAAWVFGIQPEVAPIVGVVAVVAALSVVASAWPIARALRVDPIASLRG